MLKWDPSVTFSLTHLPGKKFILSNGPKKYVTDVLEITQLSYHFSNVYSVEDANFHPKPDRLAYQNLRQNKRLIHSNVYNDREFTPKPFYSKDAWNENHSNWSTNH